MSDRTDRLAQRRKALRLQCEVQRAELGQTMHEIESRLGSVDRGLNMVRRYAAQPLLLVAGIAFLAFLGPRRLVRWAGRSAVFVTAGRRVMRLLR